MSELAALAEQPQQLRSIRELREILTAELAAALQHAPHYGFDVTVGGHDWAKLGMHCSETERRADEASREVDAWLKAYYMKDRVGEEFDALDRERMKQATRTCSL